MLSQSNSGWDFIDDANKRRSILAHAPLRTTSGENLAPLTALAWQVVAYDTESSALANVTQSMKTASLVGVLAIAVIIIIAAETARRLTKPIDDLTMAAEAITAGDLSRRANPSGVIEMLTLANAFNSLTSRLQQSLSGLEHRVAERTRDLEKRSLQIQAASEVGRAAASILDVNELLQNTVELIRERFELYYTGIFMADANNEWAVLRAGTGEAGKAMLARRHRIKIGEGMIGWCIKNAQARIAEEARLDTVRKVNPDLPNTRSEAALPLRSRNKVLGAISVQSEQVNAFDEATLIVLQTMADQVAVALENARLFAESNEALEATRRAYGELSREAWTRLLGNQANQGYRVDESGLTPLVGAPTVEAGDTELPAPAAQAGQAQPGKSVREVSVPVEVRGQRLGTLTAHKHETAGAWTEEEETLLKALVEQLNVALDNARLYTDTQRRAERERILANITAKVRASANVDTILQTALQEVAASLSVTKGTILLKRTEKDEPLKSEAPAEPGGGKTND
jgi:GAF domain-containing protein/HAMP domain-containing protein